MYFRRLSSGIILLEMRWAGLQWSSGWTQKACLDCVEIVLHNLIHSCTHYSFIYPFIHPTTMDHLLSSSRNKDLVGGNIKIIIQLSRCYNRRMYNTLWASGRMRIFPPLLLWFLLQATCLQSQRLMKVIKCLTGVCMNAQAR